MGNSPSALQQCIETVGNGRVGFAGFPSNPLYQVAWVKPYNLDIPVSPAAVVRPQTAEDISGVIKCAAANNVKVQTKSGGHSYGNYGLGGVDGAVAIDMVNFQHFSIDDSTWQATIGAGTRLGEVSEKLHKAGGRAMAHGVCPGVGIGGHATIGGLGPMSRMWGSCLDHVIEVEVVTADGKIQRASNSENSDLFWALRGAASGFGVITEFVVKTHPEPKNIIQYEYTVAFGSQAEVAPLYSAWQNLIADPALDRRFGSMFIMMPLGAVITGTFYGTEAEYQATGIPNWLPKDSGRHLVLNDWLGSLAHDAEKEALYLSNIPTPFYSKSLAFKREDLLSEDKVKDLFKWVDKQDKGTLLWFIIFDAAGGAISDVPSNATAFAHRDKILYYQSYAVGLPLAGETKNFVTNFHNQVLAASSNTAYGTYPGYVDPALSDGQRQYWDSNLPVLQELKKRWDPSDLFHNPQSVRGE
ncbi:Berberine bridge enzyme [Madurella fahalii]|uniref:Berberine bridge enzyme n=1 Tax=Madurella fahalii TaxID=1157608 RepID=A0ABQ0GQ33_9PEZI